MVSKINIELNKRTLYYIINKELKVIYVGGNFVKMLDKKEIKEDYSNEKIYLGNQLDNFLQGVLEKNGKISTQSIFKNID